PFCISSLSTGEGTRGLQESLMTRERVRPASMILPAVALLGLLGARGALGQVGACCLPDGNCQQLTEDVCNAINDSFFVGEGAGCQFFNCATVGACCLPNGTCDRMTEADCAEANGTFQGQGTGCAGTECPLPQQSGACCLPNGTCQ